ncbi:MAG: BtpA/SgcQ family protein [Acidimicrobiia bacterium]
MTPRLIGMVHLGALPGSPAFDGDLTGVIDRGRRDAATLADAGFDAVMVENFGDAPFFADTVPPATIAAMTVAAAAIADAVDVPIGINVLRNDALAALAIASAVGAGFIRVNVLSGTMFTDQGPIVGRAAEVARARRTLAPNTRVFADVFVKHATPPPGSSLRLAAADLWERGGADALIVSGDGTGDPVDPGTLSEVTAAVPGAPVLVGSGATAQTVGSLLAKASGVIVGTAVKVGGVTTAPVDATLARQFVAAAG